MTINGISSLRNFALVSVLAALMHLSAAAQTQESMPLNGGTLSWTVTTSGGVCGDGSFSVNQYSNFAFSYNYPSTYHSGENIPVSVSLPGSIPRTWRSSTTGCPAWTGSRSSTR